MSDKQQDKSTIKIYYLYASAFFCKTYLEPFTFSTFKNSCCALYVVHLKVQCVKKKKCFPISY